VTLDEMNLARVEHYFARFLSGLEVRVRKGTAMLELAPGKTTEVTPNLRFTGTVNVDETTHGFADKVYDRAQLLELRVPREAVEDHLEDVPYQRLLVDIWDAVDDVAPFAFRVIDEIRDYVGASEAEREGWEEALDEQILQKVLPKVKGTDQRTGPALEKLIEIAGETLPLTREKAARMHGSFQQFGFASYH
jgi:5-methylcytosine-specific restriction endonuclease McrBC GTP-binding regulatory subunit McrB